MSTSCRFAAAILLSALAFACKEDAAPPSTSGGSDAGTSTPADAAADAAKDSGSGPKGPEVNFCKSFEDRTDDGASREIAWDFTITAAPERCMKVRAGQTVSWSGDLTTHPLTVSDVAVSDVKLVPPGAQVTFGTPGTFGFECLTHTEMKGAILVE